MEFSKNLKHFKFFMWFFIANHALTRYVKYKVKYFAYIKVLKRTRLLVYRVQGPEYFNCT